MPENSAHFIDTNILSFWDSLIVSAAFLSGVEIIYSEDMQDGSVIRDSLRIQNPFK